MATEQVLGSELKVGDVIRPWGGRTARITELRPYAGRLRHLWPNGAWLASFAAGSDFRCGGMTIDASSTYDRVTE